MLVRAVAHDVDQFGIAQHLAVEQERPRHLDLVVGECRHQVAGGGALAGEALRPLSSLEQAELANDAAEELGRKRAVFLGRSIVRIGRRTGDGQQLLEVGHSGPTGPAPAHRAQHGGDHADDGDGSGQEEQDAAPAERTQPAVPP